MKRLNFHQTRGQSLVIFIILSLALIGLLALSLDFGFSMYSRRVAQNAADSAALAAARILCMDNDPLTRYTTAITEATNYAETYNHAFIANPPNLTEICMYGDLQSCSSDLDKGQARVVVEITHPTFAARLFGTASVTVPATATAGCFAPGGVEGAAVIPIAWKCDNISCDVVDPTTGEEQCTCGGLEYIPTDGTCDLGVDPMYIFSDQSQTYYWCQQWGQVPLVDSNYNPDPNGTPDDRARIITCDVPNTASDVDIIPISPLNPDHKWFWVNAAGGSCDHDLSLIVANGLTDPMYTHYWYSECGGDRGVVYRDVDTYRDNSRVILPVFDRQCQIVDPLTSRNIAPCYAGVSSNVFIDATIDEKVGTGNQSTNWYHMAGAALFDITCVEDPNSRCQPTQRDPTPRARQWLEDNNPNALLADGNSIHLNWTENSFEGCFVEGYVPGLIGRPSDGVQTGAWTLYLVR